MTRPRDPDQTLRTFLEEGADLAPERFVWAALEQVERSRQRGAWSATLEGFLLTLKPLVPILSVAAAAIVAIVAYQFLVAPNTGSEASPTPAPSVSAELQSPRAITVVDLETMLIGGTNLPAGWEIAYTDPDRSSLIGYPTRSSSAGLAAFALLDTLEKGLARGYSGPDGVYATWVAVFATEADAQRAAEIYLADFTDPGSWALELRGLSAADDPEGATFVGSTLRFFEGLASEEPIPVEIRFWRVGRVLVAFAATLEGGADPALHMIGDNMVARVRDLAQ